MLKENLLSDKELACTFQVLTAVETPLHFHVKITPRFDSINKQKQLHNAGETVFTSLIKIKHFNILLCAVLWQLDLKV
jgi:hypothetical protein